MAIINLLDPALINKIAAGEVVERPASVVKELCENAMDAGAKHINAAIADGGASLISVSDDGCGIETAYVRAAFLSHATSKIAKAEDLDSILTLGFRGEALSSIAAVSRVEMVTRAAGTETGTAIEIDGGVTVYEREAVRATGTDIIVRALFYNVPARRKFLKKPQAESALVSDLINKLALARPDIAFTYSNNGTNMLKTPGDGDPLSAIAAVYGRELANLLLPVSLKKGDYSLEGFIGRPETARASRAYEILFVNRRLVKSELLSAAAEEVCRERLFNGRFPVFILNLSTPPSDVDVNVHPSKLTVRFGDEDFYYDLVKSAVEKAFAKQILIPAETFREPAPAPEFTLNEAKAAYTAEPEDNIPALTYIALPPPPEPEPMPEFEPVRPAPAPEQQNLVRHFKIAGQVFGTYWLAERGDSLYLIDQHAAHERVLYDELTEKYQREAVPSQRLITPLALNLTQAEALTLTDNMELLRSFGFEIEEFGGASFALRAVPYIMKSGSGAAFFTELIDLLGSRANVAKPYDARRDEIAVMACRAAVKARDRLSYAEARGLIERLLAHKNPFTCPHGRPTIVEITKRDIEKMFRRVN